MAAKKKQEAAKQKEWIRADFLTPEPEAKPTTTTETTDGQEPSQKDEVKNG